MPLTWIDRAAKAARSALGAVPAEPDWWERMGEGTREHWRNVVRAVMAEMATRSEM